MAGDMLTLERVGVTIAIELGIAPIVNITLANLPPEGVERAPELYEEGNGVDVFHYLR